MTDENYSRLKEKIASLPSGGITYKKINGRKYAYYQWREDGRQRSRRVKADELDALSEQIALRKGYQSILKEAQADTARIAASTTPLAHSAVSPEPDVSWTILSSLFQHIGKGNVIDSYRIIYTAIPATGYIFCMG